MPKNITGSLHVFETSSLLPQAWADTGARNGIAFNPAITLFQDQLIMAYRVVTPDGRRRLAICRLTPELRVVPRSVAPLSDSIQNGGEWHADARFCASNGRLFVHYNDGWQKNGNHIFLVELDPDTLQATGPARHLVLDGPRQTTEKNWLLFEYEGELWAVYRIAPHIVLRLEFSPRGDVTCYRVYESFWDASAYSAHHGQLRGGTPPIRLDNTCYSFFHSAYPVSRLPRLLGRALPMLRRQNVRYVAGFYGFAATPPFRPVCFSPMPVLTPGVHSYRRHYPALNKSVERSVYPTGAVVSGGQWWVSYGLNDELCCLETFDHAMLLKNTVEIAPV